MEVTICIGACYSRLVSPISSPVLVRGEFVGSGTQVGFLWGTWGFKTWLGPIATEGLLGFKPLNVEKDSKVIPSLVET